MNKELTRKSLRFCLSSITSNNLAKQSAPQESPVPPSPTPPIENIMSSSTSSLLSYTLSLLAPYLYTPSPTPSSSFHPSTFSLRSLESAYNNLNFGINTAGNSYKSFAYGEGAGGKGMDGLVDGLLSGRGGTGTNGYSMMGLIGMAIWDPPLPPVLDHVSRRKLCSTVFQSSNWNAIKVETRSYIPLHHIRFVLPSLHLLAHLSLLPTSSSTPSTRKRRSPSFAASSHSSFRLRSYSVSCW